MAIFRFGTKRNIGSGATGLKALAIWYTPQGLEPRTHASVSSQRIWLCQILSGGFSSPESARENKKGGKGVQN